MNNNRVFGKETLQKTRAYLNDKVASDLPLDGSQGDALPVVAGVAADVPDGAHEQLGQVGVVGVDVQRLLAPTGCRLGVSI